MFHRKVLALSSLAALGACSGAVHQLPTLDQSKLSLAQTEVAAETSPQRHAVSDDEVLAILKSALGRIRPSASQLCREMAVGTCDWRFVALKDRSLNASAGLNGVIAVNRGIVEYADNEDEVAMVIAHEIGHQIANHVVTGQRNRAVGALIGAVLLGAAGAVASYRSPYAAEVTSTAMQAGGDIGGAIGRISYFQGSFLRSPAICEVFWRTPDGYGQTTQAQARKLCKQ